MDTLILLVGMGIGLYFLRVIMTDKNDSEPPHRLFRGSLRDDG